MTAARIRRLERRARARRTASPPSAAVLADVIDRARRTLAGEVLPAADWTHAPPSVAAHRARLLAWLESKPDDPTTDPIGGDAGDNGPAARRP